MADENPNTDIQPGVPERGRVARLVEALRKSTSIMADPAMTAIGMLLILFGVDLCVINFDFTSALVLGAGVLVYDKSGQALVERKIAAAYSAGFSNGVSLVVDGGGSVVEVSYKPTPGVPQNFERLCDIRRRTDAESVARSIFLTSELTALIQNIEATPMPPAEIAAAARDIQTRAARLRGDASA